MPTSQLSSQNNSYFTHHALAIWNVWLVFTLYRHQWWSQGQSPKAKTKAKAVVHKAKAKVHKAKDKVINRDQGLRQGHDEPTQYHFLWHKYLPVTNSVY